MTSNVRGKKLLDATTLGAFRMDETTRTDVDPLILAAEMFKPRSTDSFERWAQQRLSVWLNPAQKMINESILRNRYTAVPSCHSAGKSFFSALKVGHFIDSHTLGSAFVVTTAPTSAQIESVLWRELHRVHAKAELRGRLTRSGYPQWRIGDELIAYGRRPTEIASFQGIHARFMLIILDEADGIPEELWIAADTLASSGHVRVLAIGNPDSADSHFANVIKPGSGWNVVRVDGLRTPNFTKVGVLPYPDLKQYMIDKGIPFADQSVADVPEQARALWRDVLLTPEWVAERMPRWGVTRSFGANGEPVWREPALWLSKVRGISPTEGSEGIIPLSWVEAAILRWMEWDAQGRPEQRGNLIYGVDVADFGKDETVIGTRIGFCLTGFERSSVQDTETTKQRLCARLRTNGGSISCVDAVGIGGGVVRGIQAARLPVIPFVGMASAQGRTDATGEFTFANTRTAAYWHLRELLDPALSTVKVMLPPDDDMKTDLTIPTWAVRTGAVITMETKEQVVKRIRRSPDVGDCTVMTFWPLANTEHRAKVHQYTSGLDGFEIDGWIGEQTQQLPYFNPYDERTQAVEESRRHTADMRRHHVYAYRGAMDDDFFENWSNGGTF